MITPYEQNFGSDYQRTLPSLGDSLHRIIRHFGASTVYGVGGDFAANLIKALDRDGLSVQPSSNEMHAGFCACAQAEVEGIGFCLTTYTVGSLPVATAAALARTEGIPVVFISGAPGEDEATQTGIHHTVLPAHSWRAEYDAALDAFRALGLRAERLQGDRSRGQPNIAAFRFFELVRHAWLRREPVFIEVPRNLVFALTQPLVLPPLDQLESHTATFGGLEQIVATIRAKLAAAKAPLLYFGEQVRHNPELAGRVHALCRQLRLPYACSWFAKGCNDETDPLCLGTYNGVFSDNATRRYVEHEADYILDLGTSVMTQDTASAFATGTHVIAEFANKTVVKSTVARETDLIAVIDGLLAAGLQAFDPPLPVRATTAPAREERMDFHRLVDVINHAIRQQEFGSIFLPEVGNSFFASFSLRPRAAQLGINWLCNPWYAAMGTSLPYARVVAENVRREGLDDRVVLITGDGGFHFQLNELIHIQKQGLPLTIVYMRNDIFHLGKSGDGPIYHCSTRDFDVQQLVRAYGGEGRRCATVGAFLDYYGECLERNQGLRLIEVPCSAAPEHQCRELVLLNLYIRSRNGEPDALTEWARICAGDWQ